MSGREMMEMMRDPEVMEEWAEEMSRNPAMMSRVMEQMHRRLRQQEVDAGGPVPLFCPMLGYTPDSTPAPVEAYEPGTLSPDELFRRKCSVCHGLPDPARHTAAEWETTLERMSGYIGSADFVAATDEELDSILSYVQRRSRSE